MKPLRLLFNESREPYLLNSFRISDQPSTSMNDEEDGHGVHFIAPFSIGQVFPKVQNEGIVLLILLVMS